MFGRNKRTAEWKYTYIYTGKDTQDMSLHLEKLFEIKANYFILPHA
jgi:hypothetical protein